MTVSHHIMRERLETERDRLVGELQQLQVNGRESLGYSTHMADDASVAFDQARDLALRGVPCLLVERADLNAGASGANHGLLHSGARYVSNDPVAAQECREESGLLKRLSPQSIEETGGLFVAVAGDRENYIADFPGLCRQNGPLGMVFVQE